MKTFTSWAVPWARWSAVLGCGGVMLACGGKARTNGFPDEATETDMTETTSIETKECPRGTWRPLLQEGEECKPHTVCTTSASIAGTATSDTFCFNGWIKQWPAEGFRPEDASITGGSLLIAGSKGTEFGSAKVKTVVQEIDPRSGEMLGSVEHGSTGTPRHLHRAVLYGEQLAAVVDREAEDGETEAHLTRWERWDGEPVWEKTLPYATWHNASGDEYPWWKLSFRGESELYVAVEGDKNFQIESYASGTNPDWSVDLTEDARVARLEGTESVLLEMDKEHITARNKSNGDELWTVTVPMGDSEGIVEQSEPWPDSLLEQNGSLYLLGMRAKGLGKGHLFVSKLSTTGELGWVHEWLPMPGWFDYFPTYGRRLVLDDETGLYVCHVTYDPLVDSAGAGEMDVFFRKLSTDTGEIQWTKQFGTPGVDLAVNVLLSDDALFIVGTTEGKLTPGAHDENGVFVMRYELE